MQRQERQETKHLHEEGHEGSEKEEALSFDLFNRECFCKVIIVTGRTYASR